MKNDNAADLSPWLLNSSLNEEERRAAVARLEESEEARRELAETREAGAIFQQTIPTEMLVAHAFGEAVEGFSAAEMDRLVANSPGAAEEIEMIRQSRAVLEADEAVAPKAPATVVETKTSAGKVLPGPWSVGPKARWTALAASVAGVLVMSGWILSWMDGRDLRSTLVEERLAADALRQELAAGQASGEDAALRAQLEALSRPHLIDPSLEADATVVRSGGAADSAWTIRRDAGPTNRVLVLGEALQQPFSRVELELADGRITRSEVVPAHPDRLYEVTVQLFPAALPPGKLLVRVYGVDGENSDGVLLETFEFQIAP